LFSGGPNTRHTGEVKTEKSRKEERKTPPEQRNRPEHERMENITAFPDYATIRNQKPEAGLGSDSEDETVKPTPASTSIEDEPRVPKSLPGSGGMTGQPGNSTSDQIVMQLLQNPAFIQGLAQAVANVQGNVRAGVLVGENPIGKEKEGRDSRQVEAKYERPLGLVKYDVGNYFDGTDVTEWVQAFEDVCDQHHLFQSKDKLLSILNNSVSDLRSQLRGLPGYAAQDWRLFRTELLACFEDQDSIRLRASTEYFEKMAKQAQTGAITQSQYIQKMEQGWARVEQAGTMMPHQFITYFIKGLHAKVADDLISHFHIRHGMPATFPTLKDFSKEAKARVIARANSAAFAVTTVAQDKTDLGKTSLILKETNLDSTKGIEEAFIEKFKNLSINSATSRETAYGILRDGTDTVLKRVRADVGLFAMAAGYIQQHFKPAVSGTTYQQNKQGSTTDPTYGQYQITTNAVGARQMDPNSFNRQTGQGSRPIPNFEPQPGFGMAGCKACGVESHNWWECAILRSLIDEGWCHVKNQSQVYLFRSHELEALGDEYQFPARIAVPWRYPGQMWGDKIRQYWTQFKYRYPNTPGGPRGPLPLRQPGNQPSLAGQKQEQPHQTVAEGTGPAQRAITNGYNFDSLENYTTFYPLSESNRGSYPPLVNLNAQASETPARIDAYSAQATKFPDAKDRNKKTKGKVRIAKPGERTGDRLAREAREQQLAEQYTHQGSTQRIVDVTETEDELRMDLDEDTTVQAESNLPSQQPRVEEETVVPTPTSATTTRRKNMTLRQYDLMYENYEPSVRKVFHRIDQTEISMSLAELRKLSPEIRKVYGRGSVPEAVVKEIPEELRTTGRERARQHRKIGTTATQITSIAQVVSDSEDDSSQPRNYSRVISSYPKSQQQDSATDDTTPAISQFKLTNQSKGEVISTYALTQQPRVTNTTVTKRIETGNRETDLLYTQLYRMAAKGAVTTEQVREFEKALGRVMFRRPSPMGTILLGNCSKPFKALLDTGAEINSISLETVGAANLAINSFREGMFPAGAEKVHMANGFGEDMLGWVLVDVQLQGTDHVYREVLLFVTPPHWNFSVILGMPFMRSAEVNIDCRSDGRVEISVMSENQKQSSYWQALPPTIPQGPEQGKEVASP
jgi:hypothetical protein